jgi:hypothetical protein
MARRQAKLNGITVQPANRHAIPSSTTAMITV